MFTRSSACSLRLPAISTTHCISPHYLLNIPLSAYPHPMVVCSRMAFGIRLWVGLHFDSFFIISRGFYHIQACRYCKKLTSLLGVFFVCFHMSLLFLTFYLSIAATMVSTSKHVIICFMFRLAYWPERMWVSEWYPLV